jgi:DNA-directed RNA polymerase alpha subunit
MKISFEKLSVEFTCEADIAVFQRFLQDLQALRPPPQPPAKEFAHVPPTPKPEPAPRRPGFKLKEGFVEDQNVLQMGLNELDLPVRAANCLRVEGIETVGDLIFWNSNQLLRIPNFGRLCLNQTKEAMLKLGYEIIS